VVDGREGPSTYVRYIRRDEEIYSSRRHTLGDVAIVVLTIAVVLADLSDVNVVVSLLADGIEESELVGEVCEEKMTRGDLSLKRNCLPVA